MGYSLWKLVVLALAANSQQTSPARPSVANQTFEVDVVFPRPLWETYAKREFQIFKTNEIIPLVLAVQNLTEWKIGNNTAEWYWYIYSHAGEHLQPVDLIDTGRFNPADAGKTGPAFLVAATNSSTWYPKGSTVAQRRTQNDTFSFQWKMGFESSPDSPCVNYLMGSNTSTEIGHNIASRFYVLPEGVELDPGDAPDEVAIPLAPHCPESNGIYHVHASPNVTETACPVEVTTVIPTTPVPEVTNQGNPCNVKIDGAVASSISSRVASITSEWIHGTAVTTEAVATSTSSGGVGVARPVQTAVAAAAGLLCGLALS